MNIQVITPGFTENRSALSSAADALKMDRKKTTNEKAPELSQAKEQQIQPEELLQNIKALTDNGSYSVRFEMYKDTNDLVINLVDNQSGETIRQIPPEEILGMRETLAALSGNIVETQS